MKYCPITYELISKEENYSSKGLRLLSPKLNDLHLLNLSAKEQREEAVLRASKMSIQGIQKKLSANLNIKDECFQIVDQLGHYILKPQSEYYPALPENEALTMTLAKTIKLEVPLHGLIYSKDHSMTYFIKRFDRMGNKKIAVEDLAQLSGFSRYTKYDSSMEQVIRIINQFCTFPKIELLKLFKLTLFNFLIGNEDMHLKNFSLITKNNKVTLSPVYDLVNSTIVLRPAKEELALPLNGKKNNLQKKDFLEYFVRKLELNNLVTNEVIHEMKNAIPQWVELIKISFLPDNLKDKYNELLMDRASRLGCI